MGSPEPLIIPTASGLYCPPGDFCIDPWKPVERAVITHAHADHAAVGSSRYLVSRDGLSVSRTRLGTEATIDTLQYGDDHAINMNGVKISMHPAGHLLGSAQVRVEYRGEVWVVSGEYATMSNPTCATFEPVRCDTFITESTFGLPVYRWPDSQRVFNEINEWWRANVDNGRTSIIFSYALGKAQRVMAGLDESIGPILAHGAVMRLVEAYRDSGVELPNVEYATDELARETRGRAMVIGPPSAAASPWMRKFGAISTAFASGWMLVRGNKRRRNVDRGFVLSDHADWPGLNDATRHTGCERVIVTHGYVDTFARWLDEQGYDTAVYHTRYADVEEDDATEDHET